MESVERAEVIGTYGPLTSGGHRAAMATRDNLKRAPSDNASPWLGWGTT